jgi:hypothetical protein
VLGQNRGFRRWAVLKGRPSVRKGKHSTSQVLVTYYTCHLHVLLSFWIPHAVFKPKESHVKGQGLQVTRCQGKPWCWRRQRVEGLPAKSSCTGGYEHPREGPWQSWGVVRTVRRSIRDGEWRSLTSSHSLGFSGTSVGLNKGIVSKALKRHSTLLLTKDLLHPSPCNT